MTHGMSACDDETRTGAVIARPVPATRSGAVRRWLVRGLVAGVVAACLAFDTSPIWDAAQVYLVVWQTWADRHPVPALLAFFLGGALATALPLPVVTVMCLMAGAMFGRPVGAVVASLAYTTGVTTAFLSARWALGGWLRRKGGTWLERVRCGVDRDGAYYLLTLRVMPGVPFFLVTLAMAVTPIRTRTFALVSWLGVLPATFLFAGAGTELAALDSPVGLLSPSVLGTLAALAVVPLAVRFAVRTLRPTSDTV